MIFPSFSFPLTFFLQQYFKSIEQVATSQGFGQALASQDQLTAKRDSVCQKLDSPTSPRTNSSFLAAPVEPVARPVTPDLVPDSMHQRLPKLQAAGGLEGLETKEMPIVAMHERVDSALASP